MDWTIHYYSDAIQREILAMPAGLLARYLHLSDRMLVFGPHLGEPQTKSMGEGLFELRLKAAEGISRVFYFTRAGQQIVMLHQFLKKSQKTPPRELRTARHRMKERNNA